MRNQPRQFCRTGIHTCTPAVTLTFDGGTRRLHWCAEHAADAEPYRASSDQVETVAQRLDRRVFAYFQTGARITIAETYDPAAGWQRWDRYRKGVTASWVRKLRATGITSIALTDGRRTADFHISELLAR
jgi:hypothetical protein